MTNFYLFTSFQVFSPHDVVLVALLKLVREHVYMEIIKHFLSKLYSFNVGTLSVLALAKT